MDRILLFIRDIGQSDIVDFYPDDEAARRALSRYVREKIGTAVALQGASDDDLITAYFKATNAVYTIVGVAGGGR